MNETFWSIVRLLILAAVVVAVWLLFGAKTAIIFAALYSFGGLIAVRREWRQYRSDNRPPGSRGGDVFGPNYAVEVFTGWPLPTIMACLGVMA